MEPKSYKCRFIQPGIISYDDQKQGTVLVDKNVLDSMAKTFRNCPVIFVPNQHDDSDKSNSFDFSDMSKNPASGLVTGIPFWGEDGWQWVEFTVWDENAIKAIENGYSVSCAYIPDETKEGGEWHQIPYDEEVTNGHYIHMAIVARPRYEGSRIFANSKGGHGIMALFGMKKNTEPPKKEEQGKAPEVQGAEGKKDEPVMINAENTTIDMNGTKVPLYEMIEAYQMKHGDENLPPELQDDDTIVLPDGTKVTVADLKAEYSDMSEGGENGGEGEEPPAEEEPEEKEKPAMTNAAPAKPKTVNKALKNAAKTDGAVFDNSIETESERLARGRKLYSSAVKNGGK